MEVTESYLEDVIEAARRVRRVEVRRALDLLERAYRQGRAVFVIGNGGSASNATHFAQDLSKGTVPNLEAKRFRVLSLTDSVAMITALANDVGYDRVFDLQLLQFARRGDILVAISGSGNSPNIVRAVRWARRNGIKVIGLTGFDGGQLRKLAHVKLHVPIAHMCKSEAVHAILLHMIVDLLKERFASK